MNKTNKSVKKVPVATIKLLPEGYGKKSSAKVGRSTSRKRNGHYVTVVTRYRTYWRDGSGTKVTAERFETSRRWVFNEKAEA